MTAPNYERISFNPTKVTVESSDDSFVGSAVTFVTPSGNFSQVVTRDHHAAEPVLISISRQVAQTAGDATSTVGGNVS